jgi:hypothetical protein
MLVIDFFKSFEEKSPIEEYLDELDAKQAGRGFGRSSRSG